MNGEDGVTFSLFLCWISMRLMLQEVLIVQENVSRFPLELLHRYLGKLYEIQSVILGPQELGWGVERKRRWTVMRHKYKSLCFRSPLNIFTVMFRSSPWFGEWSRHADRTPAWDIFFHTTHADLFRELQWACGRPGCQFGMQFSSFEEFVSSIASKGNSGNSDTFKDALATGELDYLIDYIANDQDDTHQVFSLNQNPLCMDTRSKWDRLHTVIKNAGIMWFHVCTLCNMQTC
eukprot:Skav221996  [mRNA]  locus=scaffold2020:31059:31757:- [translate_table: standard]